ncbi:hypothetical protein [Pseudomonas syringae group genomosp. 7]|uniref:hypothetical protein n=1 Tax=Pseudomonas syringae group genomosp. 7 TaxID=251699 RepID=UPI0006D5EB8B|nr:hypothetical protein [Pseudomonas syringae group genomosp. 7]UNB64195.1 hypothetical protein MME54_05225 [Pseudomonas syringae pv. helianthi]
MLTLTEEERAFLHELAGLSSGSRGNEVYVGLNLDESERYRILSDSSHENTFKEKDEYLALQDKHDFVRFKILDAEYARRVEKQSRL